MQIPPLMPKLRLDQLVVERGLAPSRERARALILAGHVLVGGKPASKAGVPVDRDASIDLLEPDHPYVGRGGVKLAHALDAFQIAVAGRECLDIGASTGGFTDVLLQRGAARVVALDVGHGQIDWTLRNDPRVVVFEKFNARHLTPADLPSPVDVVVIDVSFISLRQILPVVPALLRPGADVVALVKPQFEAGRGEVRKGVIQDAAIHQRVLADVTAAAAAIGLTASGSIPSPITGQKGNVEFLLHLRAS
jgi:23S rRNA (cytidine1920-2'-O)/16S rRNA (cytidine1409-2'-O)-methyltransferase